MIDVQLFAEMNQQCVDNRVIIVGTLASMGDQERYLRLEEGFSLVLTPTSKTSYIFDGLDNVTIRIRNKFNHILIRRSSNSRFYLDQGTISGITLLEGKQITIDLPVHNTVSLEHSSNTVMQGAIIEDSIIQVIASLDVKLNGISLPINPFINGIFSKNHFIPLSFEPPLLTLLSPN